MAKRGRERRPASTTGRLWKLTGMTTSIATRVASHQVKGLFQSEQDRATSREALMRHIGQEVAATLGQMKGAVMKVGQIASQMQDVLPREISEQLAVLQNASAPMPKSIASAVASPRASRVTVRARRYRGPTRRVHTARTCTRTVPRTRARDRRLTLRRARHDSSARETSSSAGASFPSTLPAAHQP